MKIQNQPTRKRIAKTRWYLTGWKRHEAGWILDVLLFPFGSAGEARHYVITNDNVSLPSPYDKLTVQRGEAILEREKDAQTGSIKINYIEGDRL